MKQLRTADDISIRYVGGIKQDEYLENYNSSRGAPSRVEIKWIHDLGALISKTSPLSFYSPQPRNGVLQFVI